MNARFHSASLLVIGPALMGATLGWLSEATTITALLLLCEPLLLLLGLYGTGLFLMNRQWLYGLALSLGLLLAAKSIRIPAVIQPPPMLQSDWAQPLRGCASIPESVQAPIRILTWTLDRKTSIDPFAIAAQQPDIIALQGVVDPALGDALEALLGGEALFFEERKPDESLLLVVRGSFQYCDGSNDSWTLALPTEGQRQAQMVVTFPRVDGAGVLPLVVVRLDGPGVPSEWFGWPKRLWGASQLIAAATAAIGPSRMVVLGDFQAPPTFRGMSGQLLGAGLSESDVPPSWPQSIGPLPFLPLHRLDRLWAGSSWSTELSRTLELGKQTRAPLLIQLAPASLNAKAPDEFQPNRDQTRG